MGEQDLLTNIGPKIRKIREIKGYSQEYIASKMSIKQNSYSKLESGETNLSIDRLMEICSVLEIELSTLMNFDEKMVFNNCTQNGNFGENNTFVFNAVEKIQELYERIIKAKNEEIETLNKLLKQKE